MHARLLSPWSTGLAAVMLGASFVLPREGLGVPLCWVELTTGLPCPGCGLTRSITLMSHAELGAAFRFHPFGPVVYALAVALVVCLVTPGARRRVARWLGARERAARRTYALFVALFIAFGLGRMAVAAVWPESVAFL